MPNLAINGGVPVRKELFPSQNCIGPREKEAVSRVMDSGILTGYQANAGKQFYGGPEIRALEEEWTDRFGVRHAIAINSATSGLVVAAGALTHSLRQIRRDFRAVVTPYSMTCSATAPMVWGGVPVFADIEDDCFCVDPNFFKEHFPPPVLIAVDIFGQPFDYEKIAELRMRHGLMVIEDAAQALGSHYKGKPTGTLGDIGVFSLNLGKHLTCGEGGIMMTDSDELALRCRLLMNHAEAVVNDMSAQCKNQSPISMFGFNLRMTELQAAIARVQFSRMDELVGNRVFNAEALKCGLRDIPALIQPTVREGCSHTYYVLPFKWDAEKADGIHRDAFVQAVRAELAPVQDREYEGVPIGCGYIRPIQNMPLFGLPLSDTPVCSRMWQDELIILHRFFGPNATPECLRDIIDAFHKVWENLGELKGE